jgi:hypothetical protein
VRACRPRHYSDRRVFGNPATMSGFGIRPARMRPFSARCSDILRSHTPHCNPCARVAHVPPWSQATNTGVPPLGRCRFTVEGLELSLLRDDRHVDHTPERQNPMAAQMTTPRAKVLHMQDVLAEKPSNNCLGVPSTRSKSTMPRLHGCFER